MLSRASLALTDLIWFCPGNTQWRARCRAETTDHTQTHLEGNPESMLNDQKNSLEPLLGTLPGKCWRGGNRADPYDLTRYIASLSTP
jgi:hypothetical protein